MRSGRHSSGCLAVELMNERLDAGTAPAACFPKGEAFGYELSVKERGPSRYWIAFGCVVGPTAGDGGEWEVAFDEEGRVSEIIPGSRWIA